ncbi:MAG: heme-binding protein [Alphaproteobacteria bacterium]|nr:heme-binding protein [Alphaproteobacteria bacterium]
MNDLTTPSRKLTHNGVRKLIDAAVAAADEMGAPMGIAVANDGARIVGYLLMDGARVLAQESASAKAMTAASHRMPTHAIDYQIGMGLAVSTQGKVLPLRGGVPIVIDGFCVGGIGCGSGTGEQDLLVAKAALAAVGAEIPDDDVSEG